MQRRKKVMKEKGKNKKALLSQLVSFKRTDIQQQKRENERKMACKRNNKQNIVGSYTQREFLLPILEYWICLGVLEFGDFLSTRAF